MRKLFKNEILLGIILFFFLSLIPLRWFPGNSLLLGYDSVYPLDSSAFLSDRIFSWSNTQGIEMDQSGIQGSLVIHSIDSLPQLLGFSAQSSQKIVYSFWFLLLLIAPFIFALRLERLGFVKNSYFKYVFPVLYAFNFYILEAWWIAERTKFSLVVATPLILAVILPVFKESLTFKKTLKKAILCSLILAVFNGGGWGGLPLFGGLLIALLIFYLLVSVILLLQNRRKDLIYVNLFFIFLGVFFLSFNAYTLLPFISTTFQDYKVLVDSSGGVEGLLSWTNALSANASFFNLLRLQGIPDWFGNEKYHSYASLYLSNPFLISVSFIFPVLLFLSFLKKKQDNKIITVFFFSLLLVSLLLTSATHKPLGFIFELLMSHIPGFVIFRSAFFKFGYIYWLSVSFFIALFLGNLIEAGAEKLKGKPFARIIPLILILTAIVLYHFPYLNGDMFRSDQKQFSSRVEVPYYVYDFTKWWKEAGKKDKILLLPALNNNWFFEQYNWGYLSLFPVLGNFAQGGIVENVSNLLPEESLLINKLYASINEKDFKRTDLFTSILAIRYFLVRKDFAYNIFQQESDNPFIVENKLAANPNIKKIKTFNEWVVYEYSKPRSLFTAKNQGVLAGKSDSNDYDLLLSQQLFVDSDAYLKHPFTFSHLIAKPNCLNCEMEKEEVKVVIPKPKILLDSPLYEFIKVRDSLRTPQDEPVDVRISRYIGETIKLAGQVGELSLNDDKKGEEFINLSQKKYIESLNNIYPELPKIRDEAPNPYSTFIVIEEYLNGEEKYFKDLMSSKERKQNTRINMFKILSAIEYLKNKLKEYNDLTNFNFTRIYEISPFTELRNVEEYSIRINKNSLDSFDSSELAKIKVSVDGKIIPFAPVVENGYIVFDKIPLHESAKRLSLFLPEQKNLLSTPVREKVVGDVCYSSTINNFSINEAYSLRFKSKNNFDPGLFLFIDDGKSFSPVYMNYFPLAGEQVINNRVVLTIQRHVFDETFKKLRISFCAPSLTEDLYKESIRDLAVFKITNPVPEIVLVFNKKDTNTFISPTIDYQKINQVHYRVDVKNAKEPFYLVFNQKYASGWQASIGEHYKGNIFANVWFLDKKGDYTVDIIYKPQEFFNKGLVISIVSLIIAMGLLLVTRERKPKL